MKQKKKEIFTLAVGFFCVFFLWALAPTAQAALLSDMPVTVTQPDGKDLELLASGDEYFHYYHDADKNIILQNEEGWYVYAQDDGGKPVPSDQVVGGDVSRMRSKRMVFEDIDFEANPDLIHKELEQERTSFFVDQNGVSTFSFAEDQGATDQHMANLVVFVRFPGEEEFVQTQNGRPVITFSDGNQVDMRARYDEVSQYMQKISHQKFNIETTFLSAGGASGAITSAVAPRSRSVYEANYSDNQRRDLEMEMLASVLRQTLDSAPDGLQLDYNKDGEIDNITFIVSGEVGDWSSLLWPHSWVLQNYDISIDTGSGPKRAYQFNFNFGHPRYAGLGVLSHELLHAVGYPDLYRYSYNGDPVGAWDAMGSTDYRDPQFLGGYLKEAYAGWGNLKVLTESGTYTLDPIGTDDVSTESYLIPTEVPYEYIALECRKPDKSGVPNPVTDNVPTGGLLVYRVNQRTVQGNRNGNPNTAQDEIYIYRDGDAGVNYGTTGLSDAYLNGAALLPGESFGDPDLAARPNGKNKCIYLSSGKNTGIVIDDVKVSESGAVTFHVSLPSPEGEIDPDGAYNVDAQDYAITKSGDYRFSGSTKTHRIMVLSGEANIYLDDVTIDLSNADGSSPIDIRDGAKVNLYLSGSSRLAGGEFAAGVAVASEAELNIFSRDGTKEKGKLTAVGGAGCSGIGSSGLYPSGSITADNVELHARGGGDFMQAAPGGIIIYHTSGASAIGGRDEEVCGPITLQNCVLDLETGYNTSIANAWRDYSGAAYGTEDITIVGCTGKLAGSIVAGGKIRLKDTDLNCGVGEAHGPISALLSARDEVTIDKGNISLQGDSSTSGIEVVEPGSAIEVKTGTSLKVFGMYGAYGAEAGFFRVEQGVELEMLAIGKYPLYYGEIGAGCDPKLSQGIPFDTRAVSAWFDNAMRNDTTLRLQKDGVPYALLFLPAKTRSVLISIPEDGNYSFRDANEAATEDIEAIGLGIHGWDQLFFQAMSEKAEKWDLTSGPLHITKDGAAYTLSGISSVNTVTVDPDVKNVRLYLQGVTFRGSTPFLELGERSEAVVTAVAHTDNILENTSGSSVSGSQGSRLSLNGTGMLAVAGAGAPALQSGDLRIDQSLEFSAYSDSRDAVSQTGSQWTPENGLEPVLTFVELSEPLTPGLLFTVQSDTAVRSYQAPTSIQASHVLLSLPEKGDYMLRTEENTMAALACPEAVNRLKVTLRGEEGVTEEIDLSTIDKNYSILENGTYTVTGANTDTRSRTISVASGLHVTIILDGVNYQKSTRQDKAPFLDLQGSASVTLLLRKSGTQDNVIFYDAVNASSAAISVPGNAMLTIKEDEDQPGTLDLTGRISGPGTEYQGANCGTLVFRSGTAWLKAYGDCVFGGFNAKVRILGGDIHSTPYSDDSTLGGFVGGVNSDVQISGGELEILKASDEAALGGENAHVLITGGKICIVETIVTRISVGGQNSVVMMDGGSLTVKDPKRPGSDSSMTAVGGEGSSITLNSGCVELEFLNGAGASTGIFGGKSAEVTLGKTLDLTLLGSNTDMVLFSSQCAFENQCGLFYGTLAKKLAEGESQSLCISENGKAVHENLKLPGHTCGIAFTLPLPDGPRAVDLSLDSPSGSYAGGWRLNAGSIKTVEGIEFGRPRIKLLDRTFPYDGKSHSLYIDGSGASVSYSGNGQTEPGEYTVTARITPAGGTPYDLTATLTILKAELPVLSVTAIDKEYDGTVDAKLSVTTRGVSLPADAIAYTASFDSSTVGSEKPVTIQSVKLTGQWNKRYKLTGEIPKTSTASIRKKTLSVIFGENGNLYQSPGAGIRPVNPTFEGIAEGESLSVDEYTVTYQKSGGAASTELPKAVGSYQVSVKVDRSPNYQGSGTAVLQIVAGHDIGTSPLVITSPGSYLVYGKTAANGIEVRSEGVTLLLSGADIRPVSGVPLAVSAEKLTLQTAAGTENTLAASSGAAVRFTKTARLTLGGSGRCSVLGGGTAAALSGPAGSTCVTEGEEVLPFVFYSAGSTVCDGFEGVIQNSTQDDLCTFEFQKAPVQDMAFSLETSCGDMELVLPARYRSAAVVLPGLYRKWESNGYEGYYSCVGFLNLWEKDTRKMLRTAKYLGTSQTVAGIPLQASTLNREYDLKKGAVSIRESGTYTVTGDPGSALTNRITVGDGLVVRLILRDVRIGTSTSSANSGLVECGADTALSIELQGRNSLANSGSGSCIYAGEGCLVELDGEGELSASAAGTVMDTSGRMRIHGGSYTMAAKKSGEVHGIRAYNLLIENGDFDITCSTYTYEPSSALCADSSTYSSNYMMPALTIRDGTFDLKMERGTYGLQHVAALFCMNGTISIEGGQFQVFSEANGSSAIRGVGVDISGGNFQFQLPAQPSFGIWSENLRMSRDITMRMWLGVESNVTGGTGVKTQSSSLKVEKLVPSEGYTPQVLEFYLWDKEWNKGKFMNYPADLSVVNVSDYPDQPIQEKVPGNSYQGFAAVLPGSGSYLASVIPEKDDPVNPSNISFASFVQDIDSPGVTRIKVEPVISSEIKRMQVSFDDESFVYDGKSKSLRLRGSIPPNAVVTYGGNSATDPGEYNVSVSVRALGYADVATSAKLTIQPAILSVRAEADDKAVYDNSITATGQIVLKGIIPGDEVTAAEGASFEFADANVGRDKDVLVKNVKLAGKDAWKYTLGEDAEGAVYHTTASILEKAPVSLSILKDSLVQRYDGKAKKVQVSATATNIKDPSRPDRLLDLPCTVLYDGKPYDEKGAYPGAVGSYTVSVSVSEPNFQETTILGTLNIVPPDITGITLQDASVEYDGMAHGLAVSGLLEGDTVDYFYQPFPANTADPVEGQPVDAGSYLIFAKVKRDAYKDATLQAKLTIEPKKVAVSGVKVPSIREDQPMRFQVRNSTEFDKETTGILERDEVALSYTAAYRDNTVKDDKPVDLTELKLEGTGAKNYALVSITAVGVGTVLKKETSNPGPSPNPGPSGGGGTEEPDSPEEPEVLPYRDVHVGHWSYEGIAFVTREGLMQGTQKDEFSPDGVMTRGMAVAVLYRMAGQPELGNPAVPSFGDVQKDSYYSEATAWAKQEGIMMGTGEDMFSPNGYLTREQLAATLYRYEGEPETSGDLKEFSDSGTASPYARKALAWAVENGILSGKGGGVLDPKGQAKRCEFAAMLHRYSQK